MILSLQQGKFEYRDKHLCKENAHENKDRDWNDAPTGQGIPKITSKLQELRERQAAIFPLQLSDGTKLVNTLVLDFQSPELWNSAFQFGVNPNIKIPSVYLIGYVRKSPG